MNFVIVGKSGSGKTELCKILTEQFKYEKIVTYTTRPIRDGEVDGVDYNFVSLAEFNKMLDEGKFAEYFVAGNGWHYGTAKEDFGKDNMLIILTPSGLKEIKKNGVQVKSIYVKVDDNKRYIRQILRGDDIKEIARRSETDKRDFEGIEDKVDYIVENNTEDIWDCVRAAMLDMSNDVKIKIFPYKIGVI